MFKEKLYRQRGQSRVWGHHDKLDHTKTVYIYRIHELWEIRFGTHYNAVSLFCIDLYTNVIIWRMYGPSRQVLDCHVADFHVLAGACLVAASWERNLSTCLFMCTISHFLIHGPWIVVSNSSSARSCPHKHPTSEHANNIHAQEPPGKHIRTRKSAREHMWMGQKKSAPNRSTGILIVIIRYAKCKN